MRLPRFGGTRDAIVFAPGTSDLPFAILQALVLLWRASDRICSKLLKALVSILIPAIGVHGHMALAMDVRAARLTMSASTIDRVLQPQRERILPAFQRHLRTGLLN